MKTRTGNLFKRNGIYYVRWRVNKKLFMRSTGETDIKKARAKRDEILAPFLAGREVDVLRNVSARIEGRTAELEQWDEQENPPLKLADAWRTYIRSVNRPDTGPSTLEQYGGHYKQFVAWMKKNHSSVTTMRDVTPAIAEEYAQHLNARRVAAGTFNKHLNSLALIFRVLRDKARMQGRDNPWSRIRRKRIIPNSRRELTVDELQKVCTEAEAELRLLFAVGIYTGLRLGDCATLRWSEIDLHRGVIRRIPNKMSRRHNTPVMIPIHTTLGGMLAEIPAAERGEYVLPDFAARYLREKGGVSKEIQNHFNDCGITTVKPGTGQGTGTRAVVEVGFHSLRHTFVSLCREANAPLAVVEAIVGHASPAMTRHYTHIGEAAAGAAVAALPDITGTAKAALPAGNTVTIPAATLRDLAERLTPENAEQIRTQLLDLVEAS